MSLELEANKVKILSRRTNGFEGSFDWEDSLEKIDNYVVGTSTFVLLHKVRVFDNRPMMQYRNEYYVFRLTMPFYEMFYKYEPYYGNCASPRKKICDPSNGILQFSKIFKLKSPKSPLFVSRKSEFKVNGEKPECVNVISNGIIKDLVEVGSVFQYIQNHFESDKGFLVRYEMEKGYDKIEYIDSDFWQGIWKMVDVMHIYYKPEFRLSTLVNNFWFNFDFTESIIAEDNRNFFNKVDELKRYMCFVSRDEYTTLQFFENLMFPEEFVILDEDFNVKNRLFVLNELQEGEYNAYLKSFLLKKYDGNDIVLLTPVKITVERR